MNEEFIDNRPDEAPEDDLLAFGDEIEEYTAPSLTYSVQNGRIIGMIDEKDAMSQAIDKVLRTERFIFEIYDDQYGHDLNDLIGKDYDYVLSEIERMVKEALLGDDRVDSVDINEITQLNATTLSVTVSITTMFGEIETEMEVEQ
ncbi:DUF2634 domain-containing protein [Weissella ceti]|uniref:DUF2634 domain-containing protein n=1 Tax=Weissella ceti TaxID=759620 RepID=A0ABT3E426_9LACO|nr:DUF2634 domain-containing protein [Weissella ceti]MCW0953181.1 DUF2634 domain-containing protein [Weissella ceti]QVK12699.1 DUF2634 domain-containing protein [Weissella ceti]